MKIDEIIPSKAKLNDQLAHLRQENARLQSDILRLHRESGGRQLLAQVIRETVKKLEPLPPVAYRVPKKLHSDAKMAVVLKLSDWQIGEVIRAEETERFGVFNWKIAQERIGEIVRKVIGWTATHRMAFNIPHLYVFCEQDFISGDIHDELKVTNEFPSPVQSVRARQLLAKTIATLAPYFPEVHVCQVGGETTRAYRKNRKRNRKRRTVSGTSSMRSRMKA
jgi:hypothetical protein